LHFLCIPDHKLFLGMFWWIFVICRKRHEIRKNLVEITHYTQITYESYIAHRKFEPENWHRRQLHYFSPFSPPNASFSSSPFKSVS
jgi:hypothetical protein